MISAGVARAGHEQGFADRIFVSENFARAGLADQHHVGLIGQIVLIEVAAGEQRNAPGLENSPA